MESLDAATLQLLAIGGIVLVVWYIVPWALTAWSLGRFRRAERDLEPRQRVVGKQTTRKFVASAVVFGFAGWAVMHRSIQARIDDKAKLCKPPGRKLGHPELGKGSSNWRLVQTLSGLEARFRDDDGSDDDDDSRAKVAFDL